MVLVSVYGSVRFGARFVPLRFVSFSFRHVFRFGSLRFALLVFSLRFVCVFVFALLSLFRLTVQTAGTQEAGGQKPRVLSIDDYYMAEVPEEGTDERGLKRKGIVMKYQPDAEMEEVFTSKCYEQHTR